MHYRKIWAAANGSIPDGFDIHHVDGDRSNNDIDNLKCVSKEEHYQIHYAQGDWDACAAILKRMNSNAEEQRNLNSIAGKIAHERGKGIHGLSLEQKRINSSLGGKAHTGTKWYNNGSTNIRARKCPPGFTLGKLGKCGYTKGRKLGVFWNKDGKNIRSEECPGDGWVKGKHLTEAQRARRIEIARNIKR